MLASHAKWVRLETFAPNETGEDPRSILDSTPVTLRRFACAAGILAMVAACTSEPRASSPSPSPSSSSTVRAREPTFREFPLPAASHTHYVAPAPDGTLCD